MRILTAAALVALAVFSAAPAHAADLGGQPRAYGRFIERAVPYVIYDYEPGIMIRAYWAAPWQNRRYYPITGSKPEVGRDEETTGDVQKPAQDYFRSWSTSMFINRALVRAEPPLERFDVPQK